MFIGPELRVLLELPDVGWPWATVADEVVRLTVDDEEPEAEGS